MSNSNETNETNVDYVIKSLTKGVALVSEEQTAGEHIVATIESWTAAIRTGLRGTCAHFWVTKNGALLEVFVERTEKAPVVYAGDNSWVEVTIGTRHPRTDKIAPVGRLRVHSNPRRTSMDHDPTQPYFGE